MRDRQCALNHDATSHFHCLRCVINKQMTDDLWISPVYDDLLWRNFLSPQSRNCSRDFDHAHLGSTHSSRLTLRMADPCTKSEVSSVSRRRYYMGCKILKRVIWPWPSPFQGRFFFGRVGLAMVSQYTKFEVSRFSRYEAMNGSAKCRKWGGLGHSRSSTMSPFERIWLPIRL